EARKIVGAEKIVGVSTHHLSQAKQAVLDGANYIGVGPVFRSLTKSREILPGLAYAKEVAGAVTIPTVAIAGIDEANVEEVLASGVQAVAVTAAVAGCDDPAGAARRLKARFEKRDLRPGKGR
ncbi:MAG: Thiamin-phosphate pyrophosphorylase, partial [Phycisphaerales bacterium]|nr:Thiamin-phosphate pyrophosphorylase [Phycisphaerales bacterium]